jgi:hypothetical protein
VNGFEDIVESLQGVDDKESSRLSKLADFLVKLEAHKADLEKDLKVVDEDIRRVQEHEIPALMAELGFKKFTLENGAEVSVKPYYSASIAKDRQDEAFNWLNANGFGDLIKNIVQTKFGKGEDAKAEAFVQECYHKGLTVEAAKKVEPMTLKAFVKEQIEKGDSPPDDLFGIYVGQKATIKKGK